VSVPVVVVNAVTVPPERAEEFEARFAARAGAVEQAPGFEAFELLRPTEGARYLVYTRWRSEADFEAWTSSHAFSAGHRAPAGGEPIASESEIWKLAVVEAAYAGAPKTPS
jgi:heme oxygenase (mycobilin-producing)